MLLPSSRDGGGDKLVGFVECDENGRGTTKPSSVSRKDAFRSTVPPNIDFRRLHVAGIVSAPNAAQQEQRDPFSLDT